MELWHVCNSTASWREWADGHTTRNVLLGYVRAVMMILLLVENVTCTQLDSTGLQWDMTRRIALPTFASIVTFMDCDKKYMKDKILCVGRCLTMCRSPIQRVLSLNQKKTFGTGQYSFDDRIKFFLTNLWQKCSTWVKFQEQKTNIKAEYFPLDWCFPFMFLRHY